MEYSVIEQIEKPSLVLKQDFCNPLSLDTWFTFKKSTETSSDCSWTVTEGMAFGQSIHASIGIPAFGGVEFEESLNMSFSKTETQSTSHKDRWEIESNIPVPALTYVDATFTVIETDFSATWSADVVFKGCTNVWFKDKLDNHWEWWHTAKETYGN